MTITVAQARKVCNQTELDLVMLSTAKQIRSLDIKQIKSKLNRTRILRDKWRDLSEKQTRVMKVETQSKIDEANARTALKVQLFSETLDRYSKRMAVLEPSTATSEGLVTVTAKPKSVPKHRTQRADIRTVLADVKDQHNVALPTKSSAKIKPAGKPQEVVSTVEKSSFVKTKHATNGVETSKTKKSGSPIAQSSSVLSSKLSRKNTAPASKVATVRNAKAQAASKSSGLIMGGVKSIQAHASSQGKRNQARRNAKK
jgi:hypothetical protein